MKLLELRLKNFKGIKAFELKTDGEDLRIYGQNASGKSSLFDAFLWLLFDKDSRDRADFEIKTLDKEGNPLHQLDHEVEAVFEMDDEETIVLRKVYKEKWTKKRGAPVETFSGHEVSYYIDGVPVKKSEYDSRISQIAQEKLFKLLTNPNYFSETMHWQERRKLLLEVCGDISDDEVISLNPELADLPKILGKRSRDDYQKIITARKRDINKALDDNRVRIDEVSHGLPDLTSIRDEQTIEAHLAQLAEQRAEKEAELASLMAGGNRGAIKQQIAEIDAQLLTIETEHRREVNQRIRDIQDNIQGCLDGIRQVERRLAIVTVNLKDNKRYIEQLDKRLEELRTKWHEVATREPEISVDEVCPTCGQSIPPEKVEEARAKAMAEFNRKKAEELEAMADEGKGKREERDKSLTTIEELEEELQHLEATKKQLSEDQAGLNGDLAKAKATLKDYKGRQDYQGLMKQKEQLQQMLAGDMSSIEQEKARIEGEIAAIKQEETEAFKEKALHEAFRNGQVRVQDLEAQQKELAAEYERLEREEWLIKQFIRTKANLLTDKINSKFKLARFKLFDIQVNGDLNEVCETTYGGVPWGSLNTGARINVGLDVINTLSEYYGFTPPIWVDNAEAVTELVPVNGQLITLIVSGKDKKLRVERVPKNKPATLFEEAM